MKYGIFNNHHQDFFTDLFDTPEQAVDELVAYHGKSDVLSNLDEFTVVQVSGTAGLTAGGIKAQAFKKV